MEELWSDCLHILFPPTLPSFWEGVDISFIYCKKFGGKRKNIVSLQTIGGNIITK